MQRPMEGNHTTPVFGIATVDVCVCVFFLFFFPPLFDHLKHAEPNL